MVGGVVTTKFIVVGLTYWNDPHNGPELTAVTNPCDVLLKPVPVRTTVVPTGAPTASAVGDADVIDGPSTVNALANEPMPPPELFSRFAVCGPANEPLFTWIGHVN